ncbi:RING-H2 finger protein ATL34-like [Lotus japonicus]|uniref:RING-type domain-containing protein n=1 Tax=Lotus japonicus TaxID=34305 RepID=I3SCZ1_LOTJA|nr:RING-H2 finger protein ATL34-like [Lotus japonicus]AFK38133.1 unknown [Lotus japonicus]
MAGSGRLPGVGVPPRRRSEHHPRYHHEHHRNSNYLADSSVTALDETAIQARQRLQKKLGHFFSSFRSDDNPNKEVSLQKKDAGLGRKLLESSWLLRGTKFKKERKVCAVCLEDFQQKQQVMNLSCSHKYHSACLLPWLEAHPHCPCCRTSVQ